MGRLIFSLAIVALLSTSAAAQQKGWKTQESKAAAPAPVASGVLQSQETSWPGIVIELTEFKRKGDVITARARIKNSGNKDPEVYIYFNGVYLLDPDGQKKYQVLKDKDGNYIASAYISGSPREYFYARLKPQESALFWAKFAAPPAGTKTATLVLAPQVPPFEDVPISGQ